MDRNEDNSTFSCSLESINIAHDDIDTNSDNSKEDFDIKPIDLTNDTTCSSQTNDFNVV